jgi:arylsulfatase A-like enzyme
MIEISGRLTLEGFAPRAALRAPGLRSNALIVSQRMSLIAVRRGRSVLRRPRTRAPHRTPLAPSPLVLAALLALAACAPGDAPPPGPANLLVAEAPADVLERERLQRSAVLAESRFEAGASDPAWRVTGGEPGARGLCVAAGARELRLDTLAAGPALGAGAAEILALDMEALYVELTWSRAAGGPPWQKRIFRSDALGTARDRFRFDLEAVPDRAQGDALRIRVLRSPTARPCLTAIRWVRDEADPELLAQAAARAWRVELDHELRDARLAPADGALEVPVPALPAGSDLSVTFGVWGRPTTPVAFEIASGARTLARREVGPAQAQRWHELRLGSAELPHSPGTLRLLASLGAADRYGPTLPLWSEVRIVGSRRRDARPNVVLVSIDTLRADRMSIYGAERPTTPRLAEWAARRAVVFDDAVAQATWTLPSHASMFTSLEAFRHGAVHTEALSPEVPVLAELLRAAGYRTEAVTGAGFLDPRYGLHRGFDRYRYWSGVWTGPQEIEDGTARALSALDEARDRPFFLFFHTYDVHPPLRPHQPWFSRWSRFAPDWWILSEAVEGEMPGRREARYRFMRFPPRKSNERSPLPSESAPLVYDLYDSGVASADEHVGRILQRLREKGLEESTLVIVTSDHGESLGEHDLAGHGFLYEDNTRVPLLVALPGGRGAGTRRAAQVRLVDLLPTILEVAATPSPDGIDGRSLLPLLEEREPPGARTALTYSSWLGLAVRTDGRQKFLFWDGVGAGRSGRDRLFDLEADPAEVADRLGERADRDLLERGALRWLGSSSGLRLRLPGARAGLRVAAPWLAPDRVKWLSAPDDDARWEEGAGLLVPGGAAGRERVLLLRVPGAALAPLRFEEVGSSGARISIEAPIDLAALRAGERLAVERRDDGFALVRARGATPGAIRVAELSWQGDVGPGGADPSHDDAELRRKLGALGYLQ